MYKLVIRADDVGYTDVYNIGTFEAIQNGYVTSADVMLESPGTVDALRRLRDFPWISVGWHPHFWHQPVLPVREVPSLVVKETGFFRERSELYNAKDVVYEQAFRELSTEIERCMDILGRAPDTLGGPKGTGPFAKAMTDVAATYGIASDFGHKMHLREDGGFDVDPVLPRWESAKLYIIDQKNIVAGDIIRETLHELEDYDPVRFLLEDRMRLMDLPDGAAIMHGFHPGYVDYHVARLGDYGENRRYYTLSRTYDVEGLTSARLHDWIRKNRIQLCSLRDVLYGTSEYQNHLRRIGSDLWIS
ncbi:MAG: ChbG/HpnK family deacetylase [Lachnospiraceae bacterium]|nr:ChbG/HpnK family deacetylase [Lachnospiraceae bacterium]